MAGNLPDLEEQSILPMLGRDQTYQQRSSVISEGEMDPSLTKGRLSRWGICRCGNLFNARGSEEHQQPKRLSDAVSRSG